MFSGLVPFVLLAGVALAAGPARAGEPTDALRDFFGAVNVVLNDPTTEQEPMERLRAIRRHVNEVFDFREAAMLALGREWAARTPLEQNEFVALFADLLERSFVWRVAGKATTAGGVRVQYLGENVEGDNATVETAIAARDGNDLRLGFRMVRRSERWVVRDVVMDGVSTMDNYHAQFQRLARDGTWPELIAQLRAKVGTGSVQVAAAPPPTMWPSELRVSDRVVEPMVPVPSPPVPSAIVRPLETAVVPVRSPYSAPPPTGARPPTVTPMPSVMPIPSVTQLPTVTQMPSAPSVPPAPSVAPAPSAVAPAPSETAGSGHPPSTPPPAKIMPAPPEPVTARPALSTPPETPIATPVRDVPLTAPRVEPRIAPAGVARATVARPTAGATWWVQVGAYRSAGAAGRVAAKVHGEIFVVAAPGDGEPPLLRVRVGPFADRTRAEARRHELEAKGWRAFLVQ